MADNDDGSMFMMLATMKHRRACCVVGHRGCDWRSPCTKDNCQTCSKDSSLAARIQARRTDRMATHFLLANGFRKDGSRRKA